MVEKDAVAQVQKDPRILKCGKGREYSQLSLIFAWENDEHYFGVELTTQGSQLHSKCTTQYELDFCFSLSIKESFLKCKYFIFYSPEKSDWKLFLFNLRNLILESNLEQVKAFNSVFCSL